jgi:hypothetical protein
MVGFIPEERIPETHDTTYFPSEFQRKLPTSILDNELSKMEVPSFKGMAYTLFPFLGWILNYSKDWIAMDILAGSSKINAFVDSSNKV